MATMAGNHARHVDKTTTFPTTGPLPLIADITAFPDPILSGHDGPFPTSLHADPDVGVVHGLQHGVAAHLLVMRAQSTNNLGESEATLKCDNSNSW